MCYCFSHTKVLDLFGCHEVNGVFYLRADYSIECYTKHWYAMVQYAAVFLFFFVAGFPLFVLTKLWSYGRQLRARAQGPGQVCKLAPPGLLLGFLVSLLSAKHLPRSHHS